MSTTTTCPRCYPSMDIASNYGPQHTLGKCARQPIYQQHPDKFSRTWPSVGAEGQKSDDPGDLQQSDFLLKNHTTMKEYRGKEITKWMLENAWKKVYPTKNGVNAAEAELTKKQSTPAQSKQPAQGQASAAKQSSQHLAHRPKQVPGVPVKSAWTKAPAYPSGPGKQSGTFKQPTTFAPSASTSTQVFQQSSAPEDDFERRPRAPDYEYAVHKDCPLDNSLLQATRDPSRTGNGQRFNVAANYVAVPGTPLKVYMYGIEYGTITAVRSKKQVQEDAQSAGAEAEAKSTSGSAAAGSEEAGRKVGQRSEKARIFKALESRSPLNAIPWATDYESLWTLKPIPEGQLLSTNITYAKLSGRMYKLDTIDFTFHRELALSDKPAEAAQSLLNHDDVTKKGGSLRITALNALITRHVSSRSNAIVQVGPNKFFLKGGYDPASSLFNIHRGYYTSIRPGSDSILLNINTATAAFHQPINVAKFFDSVPKEYGDPRDLLKGLTVRIRYSRQKHDDEYDPDVEEHRHRTIAGFGDVPSKEEFEHNGVKKTVAQYFKELGATISKTDLPCISINVAPQKPLDKFRDSKEGQGSKKTGDGKGGKKGDKEKVEVKPNWVPPEFLDIDPYQAFNKLLQGKHTDDMLKVALRHPAKNQNIIINEAFPLLGIGQQDAGFDKLELTIGDKLIAVPARQLPAPSIMYRSSGQQRGGGQRGGRGQRGGGFQAGGRGNQAGQPAPANVQEASWNVMDVQFFQPPTVPQKAVCTIDMRTVKLAAGDLRDIGLQLSAAMRNHGIRFGQDPAATHGYQDSASHLEGQDDISIYNTFETDLQALKSPNMLLVLLSDKDADTYGAIKRVCDQWLGVHTVCLVVDKLYSDGSYQGPRGPLLSNLALKFNMKLRGQNHQVCLPDDPTKLAFHAIANDTIVLGADVSHPSGGMAHCPSVAAVVGSDDMNFANFPGSVRLQAGTQEMIEELEDMVYERLMRFHKNRNFLPKRMIFYRDGVSEDQFTKCRTLEIPQIMSAFERATKELKLKDRNTTLSLTFIVVGKRHHTRFFAREESQTYKDFSREGHKPHVPQQEPKRNHFGAPMTDRVTHAPIVQDVKLNGNLKPGLIVDQVITRPATDDGIFDFFLQSHAALKGTARSAHYTVLSRGSLSADQIQQLTHAFCYNYMRATKGVSYAGPAYYADRLCDRGAHYLRGYTTGRKVPGIDMSDEEKAMVNKKEASMVFAKRVVEYVSGQEVWNPRVNEEEFEGRKNPWHPSFDDRMFWL